MENENLKSILEYYRDTWSVTEPIEDIYKELIENNVEVRGNSFYCPIWDSNFNAWILLAGTKDRADTWVLKKIIKLIKSGDRVYSMLNGNSEHLLDILSKYDVQIVDCKNDLTYISFNV